MSGCNGCSPDAVELAERNARAIAEATNGRITYEEALAGELATLGPTPALDAGSAPSEGSES